jgi:hypothetical protein
MKHQLEQGMTAKCANAQEMRSAINAIKEAGLCQLAWAADGEDWELYPSLGLDYKDRLDQCKDRKQDRHIPLHEFILRATGHWVEESKELTLNAARELLQEAAAEGVSRTLAAKLAEYGIK